MLSNVSVSRKLLFMLVAPVVGLLFFAILSIQQKYVVMQEMRVLGTLIDVGLEVSTVVHEIQLERGVSVGFVRSKGAQFASEVAVERKATDLAIAKLAELAGSDAVAATPAAFRDELRKQLEKLSNLGDLRQRIDTFSVSGDDVVTQYTKMDGELLDLVVESAKLTQDPALMNDMNALVNLVHEKEVAGVERALVNAALLVDRFEGTGFADFAESLGMQEAYHDHFVTYGAGRAADLFKAKMVGAAVEDVKRTREIMKQRAREGRFGVAPGAWFASATARLEIMKEVADKLSADLRVDAQSAVERAQASLLFFVMIALAAITLAGWLAYVVGRSVNMPLTKASDDTREISSQMVAAVSQQSSSASETATAVTQTSTTVDEIRRTSEMSVEKANAVFEVATRGQSSAQQGLEAITHGIEAMRRIRAEVEGIARNILDLSEKNMQIGEIAQNVNALAEQSNLLAVNASIEAAKAGEHGKGFAVVAGEVKALAEQSKEATVQIRGILAEIQKSSNAAVMVTEQGTKRVEEGAQLIEELGKTIQAINRVNEESADAARQITAAANQQLVGIEQITSAMQNIEQAVKDNAAGIHQLEKSAQNLKAVSNGLSEIVKGRQAVHA